MVRTHHGSPLFLIDQEHIRAFLDGGDFQASSWLCRPRQLDAVRDSRRVQMRVAWVSASPFVQCKLRRRG